MGRALSPAKAVLVGHLVVNVPVLVIIALVGLVGDVLIGSHLAWGTSLPIGWVVGLLAGCAVAWLWWSWSVPRWRRWALRRGAAPDQLQRLAAATLLVWPKGSIFERTEFRPRDGPEQ
jgi:hypothetical protein